MNTKRHSPNGSAAVEVPPGTTTGVSHIDGLLKSGVLEKASKEEARGGKQTVLLVHEDSDFRRELSRGLSSFGFALEAVDARPAMMERLFAEPQPHILVVQEALPGAHSGSDLISEAYMLRLTSGMKVALLADRDISEAEQRQLRLDLFIRTPVKSEEAIRRIRDMQRNRN